MYLSIVAALAIGAAPEGGADVGPFVRALWLVQRYGTADALDPANDQRLKGAVARALGKDGNLVLSKLDTFMEAETVKRLAGPDGSISPSEVREAVEASVPDGRKRLLPRIRESCRSAHVIIRHDR